MTIYRAPVEDVMFLLDDVLQVDRYNNLPGFSEATSDVRNAIIEEAARLSEEVLHPLNRGGDLEGCARQSDGTVAVPRGFKDAYAKVGDGGWIGLCAPAVCGGQDLPIALGQAVSEFMVAANMAFWMYPALACGVAAVLRTHGTERQKSVYVPRLISGKWAGTMNLTEPHSGTDLGLMRTKAAKQSDGSYQISGTKIFITGGEQDLTENIIHLVLAKIEGAPAGIKGVSLFLVPKVLVNDDGSLGQRNNVICGSIEHKMGIRGSSTCVLNYDRAAGWLVGREHKGMEAMFVMMNEARLLVGTQGLGQSEIAYQNAAAYARDRLQGRALTGAVAPGRAADPIIVHPDVRRTLLTIRGFNEAARALLIWAALKADVAQRSEIEGERELARDYLGLLTPIIKGVVTDKGFANAVAAQQVFGGHGYIVETGMEQFVRDARISMIYEGANGVQALDLVTRKLPKDGGRVALAFLEEVGAVIESNISNGDLEPIIRPLATGLEDLRTATEWLLKNAANNLNHGPAASTDYMHLFGLVALGYMWVQMAKAASDKIAAGDTNVYLRTKLSVGAFFGENALPETKSHLARIQRGATRTMELAAELF